MFEFLCALAGAELAPERIERIANWNLSALDWEEVLRLAEHHGVLPLVARNLIEHGLGLPPKIERSLRSAYEVNLRRSMLFTAELVRIMQHFERRQLRAVPYKGAVLAQSLYRDLGLRSFSDLDFLISVRDFERAKHALAETQRGDRQEESSRGRDPSGTVGCKTASRNNVVYVRMMVKVLSPSVEHAKKPDVRTQMFRVAGEFEHRRCTSAEQQIVKQPLVLQR